MKFLKTETMRRVLSLAALLLFAAASPAYTQQATQDRSAGDSQKAVSYAFISPNVRETMTLEESVRLLKSPEELKLIRETRNLACRLRLKTRISKAVGSWKDGAENSIMFRVVTDKPTVGYASSWLGRLEHQKTVLYFRQHPTGAGVIYMLYPQSRRNNLFSISRMLDQSGVQYRTLIPLAHRRAAIYIIDLKHELKEQQIASAATMLGARLIIIRGTGDFIGDDNDREKAQQVFNQVVKDYETIHPPQTMRNCALKP
ncbi:MAG: hypothetical protein WCB68_11325 [Pyrinomonadaceae bacterium]